MTAADNPRAVAGNNNPPADEPTPFDLASNTVSALFEEARHWLDGSTVATQAEADAIGLLIDTARKAKSHVDDARKEAKRPHDEAAKAVQEQFKPLLARADLVISKCRDALSPFLIAQDEAKRKAAEEARLAAEAKLAEARASVRGADTLDEAETAEAALREARRDEAAAGRLEREKAQAKGGERAIGLRTSYRAEVVDAAAFARHLWTTIPDGLLYWLGEEAQRLVRAGARNIPGVIVHEDRRAA